MVKEKNGSNEAEKCFLEEKALVSVNRNYKDTIFRRLFNDREKLLSLYNAVAGKRYTDSELLEIVTLDNAIYMKTKNDVAFVIDFGLHLYEHQSTINPNMPLRFLQYTSDEFSRMVPVEKIYGSKLLRLPTPHFVVFYNGLKEQPERQVLRLSDAYEVKENAPHLELEVVVLNINDGYNETIKEQCRELKEYMQYVDKVRELVKQLPIEEAVNRAIDACIREGIMSEYLTIHKSEIRRMSLYEFDEAAYLQGVHEDGVEEGRAEGALEILYKLVENGLLTIEEAAGQAQISKEEFIAGLSKDK